MSNYYPYENTEDNGWISSSLIDYIEVPPAALVRAFGAPDPNKSDGYKVSIEYEFMNDEGHYFTLYDYKATTMYSNGDDMWRPEDLIVSAQPFDFHIGGCGKGNVEDFREWLLKEVERVTPSFLIEDEDNTEFNVNVSIIEVYTVNIYADNENEAVSIVQDMDVGLIRDIGSMSLIETDYVEVK
jgi:hypothetical protein